jgi:hypothetical protein
MRETGIGWTGKPALVVNGETALAECVVVFIVGIVFGAGKICMLLPGRMVFGRIELVEPWYHRSLLYVLEAIAQDPNQHLRYESRAKALVRNAGVGVLLLRGYWGGTYECEYT